MRTTQPWNLEPHMGPHVSAIRESRENARAEVSTVL